MRRRTITLVLALGLVAAACTETSDRVTEAPVVPASLTPAAGQAPTGVCSVAVGEGLGARVADVLPGSPADGQLLIGDIIVSIDGSPIATSGEVIAAIENMAVGNTIDVLVQRSGSAESVSITLGETPDAPGQPRLGVLVVTDEQRVGASELETAIPSGDLARIVGFNGELYGFEPDSVAWTHLGVTAPESGWVPIDGDVYWIAADPDSASGNQVVAGLDQSSVDFDIDDWTAQVTLTSMNGRMLVGADRINSQTGDYEAAVLAVDVRTGRHDWAWQAELEDGGVLFPTFAFRDPDDERALVVLTPPGDTTIATYALLSESNDQPSAVAPAGLPDNAVVVGWHDANRLMSIVSSISEVGLTDPDTGDTELGTLPLDEVPDGIWLVGDGSNVIVERDALELIQVGGIERRNLAVGCESIVIGELGF